MSTPPRIPFPDSSGAAITGPEITAPEITGLEITGRERLWPEITAHDAWMFCRDGTRLVARIWRPAAPGRWPVLLMRQPYGRAIASTVVYAHPSWYARHGFVVVVQDVRGRGDSEGRFGGFAQEAADGADAVRWARRLPWSNGRLGTYGFSYQGLTQLLNDAAEPQTPDPAAPEPSSPDAGSPGPSSPQASSPEAGSPETTSPFASCPGPAPPDLDLLPDCLAPAMAGLDERLHWACDGGAHWWGLGLAWALQLAAQGCRRAGDGDGWRRLRRSLESQAFLQEGLELLEQFDPEGMGLDWLRRDAGNPAGWRRHAVAPALLRRPLLLIGGWHDPHLRGVLELWRLARQVGGRPLLRIGAWSHLDWRGGIDRLQLRFFQQHLQNEPQGSPRALPPVPGPELAPGPAPASAVPPPSADQAWLDAAVPLALQSSVSGEWWQPPPPAEAALSAEAGSSADGISPAGAAGSTGGWCGDGGPSWQLVSAGLAAVCSEEGRLLALESLPRAEAAGGVASEAAIAGGEASGDEVVLVHDPWRPVPGRGGHLSLDAGPCERGDLDARCDVACFTSAPVAAPRRWLCRPVLELQVLADQPGYDLCAALSRLTGAGGPVPAAARRVEQICTGVARFLGSACLEPRWRRVELQPALIELQAGERLRLSLAAAAWPQIAVNPGDGSQPRGGSCSRHRVISLSLRLAGAQLRLEPLLETPSPAPRPTDASSPDRRLLA